MGTEKVRILDRRDFHGDVPTMIDDAVAWILTKIIIDVSGWPVWRDVKKGSPPGIDLTWPAGCP